MPILLWGSSNVSGPWGPSLAGLLLTALPPRDTSTSLGDHLSLVTWDKILRGDYVDIFSLLDREVERKDKDLMDDKEK